MGTAQNRDFGHDRVSDVDVHEYHVFQPLLLFLSLSFLFTGEITLFP